MWASFPARWNWKIFACKPRQPLSATTSPAQFPTLVPSEGIPRGDRRRPHPVYKVTLSPFLFHSSFHFNYLPHLCCLVWQVLISITVIVERWATIVIVSAGPEKVVLPRRPWKRRRSLFLRKWVNLCETIEINIYLLVLVFVKLRIIYKQCIYDSKI